MIVVGMGQQDGRDGLVELADCGFDDGPVPAWVNQDYVAVIFENLGIFSCDGIGDAM